jgi:ubiquinone/menaquinone biosynthesis C-methylase UbiE
MLQRILETEVMEQPAEAIAYDGMNHGTVNQQFVDDLLATGSVHGEILDLGTGTARIPLLLCAASEDVRVMAVDLSTGMLDVARVNLELSTFIDRIMLDRVDAKQLPYQDGRFAVVMSNSIVHHIPQPQSTFAEAIRVCQPGGLLFFRDLLRPGTDAEVVTLVETYAADEDDDAKQMFDDSLRAALTVEETRRIIHELGFAPDSVQATSDRHWTWQATKP